MPRTILIVDDEATNRQILARILRDEYEVQEARDGREALEILRRSYRFISAVLLDLRMPVMDGYALLEHVKKNASLAQIPIIVTTGSADENSEVRALSLAANDFITKPYSPAVILHRLRNTIRLRETAAIINAIQKDKLTGLYNRETFFEKAAEMIRVHPAGYYVLTCYDVNYFKLINDQYGNAKGDEVLKHLAGALEQGFGAIGGLCSRIAADNFAVLYPRIYMDSAETEAIRQAAMHCDGLPSPVSFTIGRYIVNDLKLPVNAMYDRASLAGATVKGRFDSRIAIYDESMRESILREQEIVEEMHAALACGQFEPWIQPQYNHSTGALVGGEALVRWRHPTKGLIPPNDFIPIFERNGFIYEMDKSIWKQVCTLLCKWIDEGRSPLPIAVNVSRYDMIRGDFFEVVTGLVERYGVPLDLLRLEITESAFAESPEQIIDVVKRLVNYGFTVEIDDFGSGYSSLNTLKDVPANILKLDMRFLEQDGQSTRGGNILESIVRMAKWLGMPVIAEGVERKAQADFLESIGCYYVQGYLYARPMPADDYERLSADTTKERAMIALETVENLDNNSFWDPESMDTLIFNSYVGGACIFEYHNDKIDIVRANEKYAKCIGGESCTIEYVLNMAWEDHMDEAAARATGAAIRQTIATGDDATYEAAYFGLPGAEKTYLRTTFRVIARTNDRYLLYATNENITLQREAERKERESEQKRLRVAAQLQAIMHNINGGVTAVTFDGDNTPRFIFANDQFYKQLGYTKEQYEAEVASSFDLAHPDDRAMLEAETLRANDTQEPITIRFRMRRRDGGIVWMLAHISTTTVAGIDAPVQVSVSTDITAQVESERKEHQASERLKAIMANVNSGIVAASVFADRAEIIFSNNRYYEMLGYTRKEYTEAFRDGFWPISPKDADWVLPKIQGAVRTGEPTMMEYRAVRKDGTEIWLQQRIANSSFDDTGEVVQLSIFYDITSEKEKLKTEETLRMSEEHYRLALEHSGNIIARYDIADRSVNMTPNVAALFGTPEKVTNVPYGPVEAGAIPAESADAYIGFYEGILRGEKTGHALFQSATVNGLRWLKSSFTTIYSDTGEPVSAIIVFEDVTEAREVRQKAEQDGMTGLYNKVTTEELIRQRLVRNDGTPCMFLIADLDNLKAINDNLGHNAGDDAIHYFAKLLRAQFRKTDIVGRIGGDEFAAFLDGSGNEIKLRSTLAAFIRKLTAARIGADKNLAIAGSIGVAGGVNGEDGYETLFKKADKALYHVKRNGKNDFAFYTPDMEKAVYEYKGHVNDPAWQSARLDGKEIKHMLAAVSALYPLVISANLTQNSYYMMQYDNYTTKQCFDAGKFDDLVDGGAQTFHPADRESFLRAFARNNLLAAFGGGKTLVSHTGRQRGDDGVYRTMRTDAVLMKDADSGDVLQITMARELDVRDAGAQTISD